MCERNDRMMGLGLMLALVGSLSPVQAAERRTLANGDVTITATSEENVTCEDCPNGATGTKICYQVTLDQAATNNSAKDFHIQVSDGFAANYNCKEVHEFVNGQWVVRGWNFDYASQMEGEVRRHYLSWFRQIGGADLNKGETWRFCFVYCGPTNNLDNTIEWILTNHGSNLPGIPDADGNRADVPNSGTSDDPGWSGTKTTVPGSKVGFALAACIMPDGTCEDDVAAFECLESDGEPQGDGSVCSEQICTADLDGNGVVNAADLAILLASWGPCPAPCPPYCIGDLNQDCVVNAADLAVLLASWSECPQSPLCGDGLVGEGEQCDPPDGEICDENCQYILAGCCLPDQSCMSEVTADLCQDLGGTTVTDCAECATGEIYLDLTPESISIEPTPDGMVTVSVPTRVLVSAPEAVPDIETFAEIRVNGLGVDVVPLSVDLPAEAGLCYFSAWPACDGSCPFSVPCKPFPAPPQICYCEYFTLVIAAVPANVGDLITVVLDSPDLVHEVDEQNNEISGVVPDSPTCPCGCDLNCDGEISLDELLQCEEVCGGGGGHSGDCCSANDTPGCDDPECQEIICSIDPYCCDAVWDEICAGEASELCEVCFVNPRCYCQVSNCTGTSTEQTCSMCLDVMQCHSWSDAGGNCHTTCP